ncbi:SDR family oxidoreductase [Hymenobacter gummosus]|uniref:SDR family oxidoreductase n=1 Tax=Hymenobacter gummosus TaxID=1776032 RepID=A0A3S0H9R9_9BACT|nr:SDR family oxidoreductase [Hymenobacter gummosus]RTQ53289.1 SDR family oxidoreductase [Hymenobacter gummosus]
MENGIAGKVILLTGASSGIGEATALLLAERGAKLVLGARRTAPLQALQHRIVAAGGQAVYAATDVGRRAEVAALVQLARSHYGRLDVVVSNAGIAPISLLDEGQVDDWEAMIDVNLKGLLYAIAAALPVFRQQQSGHFVNVLSTAGLSVVPTMAVYAATKNAARTLTEGLRQEAGPHLRVTGISPGFVQTNLAGSMPDPAVRAQITARMGEIGLAPEAIARAIAFAMAQPADVDVNELVVRPTAQS